jgi:hypothetical protein
MRRARISAGLRERVRRRAGQACEYCAISEECQVAAFHCDHWVPQSKGGLTIFDNLVWSCPWCNGAKHAATHATSVPGAVSARIFNPREQLWSDHFRWSADYVSIEGITSTGRATVALLKMNSAKLQRIRQLVLELGLHPGVHVRLGRS